MAVDGCSMSLHYTEFAAFAVLAKSIIVIVSVWFVLLVSISGMARIVSGRISGYIDRWKCKLTP